MSELTPLKAIRANCLDCMCGQRKEVRLCPSTDCPLYIYRFGHNPKRKGLGGLQKKKTPHSDGELFHDGEYKEE